MKLAEELESLLSESEPRFFGQLCLSRDGETFVAFHRDDLENSGELELLNSLGELREIAEFDANQEYRPLKTAPDLRSGWKTSTTSADEFLKRLDCIYPAAFATWIGYERGTHNPTPLRDTLNRQTGTNRLACPITDQMANQIMRNTCSGGCLRKIAWPISSDAPVSRLKAGMKSLPLICTEACTFAVSEARRLAKEAYEDSNSPAES